MLKSFKERKRRREFKFKLMFHSAKKYNKYYKLKFSSYIRKCNYCHLSHLIQLQLLFNDFYNDYYFC